MSLISSTEVGQMPNSVSACHTQHPAKNSSHWQPQDFKPPPPSRVTDECINVQLRASYSAVRKLEAATPRTTPIPSGACTPAITHTPAILRDENPTPSRRSPSSEEGSVREAALKSFEHFTVRRQALKANRKLTDNLLNF